MITIIIVIGSAMAGATVAVCCMAILRAGQ